MIRSTRRRTLVVAILLGIWLWPIAQPAHAQLQRRNRRPPTVARPVPPSTMRPAPARGAERQVDVGSAYYPKYTGGFHARYFDEIPSIFGTRTMRGTAW